MVEGIRGERAELDRTSKYAKPTHHSCSTAESIMSARSAKMKRVAASNQPSLGQSAGTRMFSEDGSNAFIEELIRVTEERFPDFSKTINIAMIGKVSSGKSSLINAILRRTRENPAVAVAATSGVTKKLQCFRLHEQFLIVDSPGLDDVVQENSGETIEFLKHIDLGVLVVHGSPDASQKKHYDDLRHNTEKVLVVVNKIDQWDTLRASGVEAVLAQWREMLGVDRAYPTCTIGFDPESEPDTKMDLRGVDEVRNEIETFFQDTGKDLLFAHLMGDKKPAVTNCIAVALAAVAVESFIPGSAILITATQAIAIAKLYYIYNGKSLNARSALAALPSFAAKSIGMNLFLWGKTLIETTTLITGPFIQVAIGSVGVAVAVSLTLGILATINFMFQQGYDLTQKDALQTKFGLLKDPARVIVSSADISQMGNKDFWLRTLGEFLT